MNYRVTASALTTQEETDDAPISGVIQSITAHFPPGVNALVELFVYHERKQILPEGRTGVTLDDATETFSINEPIGQGDKIKVRIVNHDDTWEHTISVIIAIAGTGEEIVCKGGIC
jgi:hypothetical protein